MCDNPGVPPIPTHPEAHLVVTVLRSHRTGVLLTSEVRPCPTVIDPIGGVLIVPMAEHELELESATLFVPDESADSLQILALPIASVPATDSDTDRFRAAHGTPEPIGLYRLKIDGARLGSSVIDGPDIDLRDPFATESASIRRALNADRAVLGRACGFLNLNLGLREGDTPVALSVDPEGIDLKGPTGLARYKFPRAARSPEELRSFAGMLLPFDPEQTQV